MNKLHLLFAGDIMQHPGQLDFEKSRNYSYDGVFDEVIPLFRGADAVIGNLETNFAGFRDDPEPRTGIFDAPDEFIRILKNIGFTHLSVNNNHMYDKGHVGHVRTLLTINDYDLNIIDGIRYDIINGTKIGFYNFTTHVNGTREHPIEIPESNNDMDVSIALPHWGGQYTFSPSEDQYAHRDILIDRGYNMIIGSGPHTVHPVTIIGSTLVAYSLGDFLSSHDKEGSTDVGMILSVIIDNGKLKTVTSYNTTTITIAGQSKIKVVGKTRMMI
jgi:poly-gamma-glutamate capsule biosynthesis protein CapA/YwtB (metallophosphatase superfamily)